jgi:hypothetical protein
LLLVSGETLAGRQELVFESAQLRDVRRGGGRRFVEELAKDPSAAFDRAGIATVATHGEDCSHPE